MPARHGALSGPVVLRIAAFVTAEGHDPEPLFRSFGLSLEALAARDSRVPYHVVEALGLRVGEVTGIENLGLRLAQVRFDLDELDPMLLMLLASSTVRRALELLTRFQRYWGDGERLVLRPIHGGIIVRNAHPFGPPSTRHTDECALAELVLASRWITGCDVVPRVVSFQHPEPADVQEHHRLFRCPLKFSQEHSELVFEDTTLELPFKTAQEHLHGIFRRDVERALKSLPEVLSFSAEVRQTARAALESGRLSLQHTAKTLRTSTRTLQRRLQHEGTSFDEIVDTLRRELAQVYLERNLSLPQISDLLGYAEASAFHHAFKRWTGRSPERSRRGSHSHPASPKPQP